MPSTMFTSYAIDDVAASVWDVSRNDKDTSPHDDSAFDESQVTSHSFDSQYGKRGNVTPPPLHNSKGKFYDTAEFIVINTKTGKKSTIIARNTYKLHELSVELKTCWMQNKRILFPESKALLEITDTTTHEKVFSGWIFSTHHSISQAFHKKYLFLLVRCVSG